VRAVLLVIGLMLSATVSSAEALIEPCDRFKVRTTANSISQEEVGSGRGSTLRDAIRRTVEDAVLDALFRQYECAACPRPRVNLTCARAVRTTREVLGAGFEDTLILNPEGAHLESERKSCEQLPSLDGSGPSGSYECKGVVKFLVDNPSSALVGCSSCEFMEDPS